jgi:hypothetical protein
VGQVQEIVDESVGGLPRGAGRGRAEDVRDLEQRGKLPGRAADDVVVVGGDALGGEGECQGHRLPAELAGHPGEGREVARLQAGILGHHPDDPGGPAVQPG